MDPADTHAVGLKLPVFWVDHPRVWLLQAEAQFAVRNVTADNTKYHYGVAALDPCRRLRYALLTCWETRHSTTSMRISSDAASMYAEL